mmetsp:Transcript_36678/g.58813  ORF Transcript_36678/g.58813 Transcript_36678/m.58813 type:complete len:102 (-) Transcript_36678:59-364(-)
MTQAELKSVTRDARRCCAECPSSRITDETSICHAEAKNRHCTWVVAAMLAWLRVISVYGKWTGSLISFWQLNPKMHECMLAFLRTHDTKVCLHECVTLAMI